MIDDDIYKNIKGENNMKSGQVVIHNQNDMLKYSIIISRNNESYDILHLDGLPCSLYNVDIKSLFYLHERIEAENLINAKLDLEIEEIKSNIKSVKRSDYSQEIKDKYYNLKNQISATAKHMIESENDTDFENKLKAICELKKQLYTIECDGLSDARKFNGNLLYKIKKINEKRNMISYYLKSNYVTNRIKTLDEETLKLIEDK